MAANVPPPCTQAAPVHVPRAMRSLHPLVVIRASSTSASAHM